MRRSNALASLSREHQHALAVALGLRRADAGTAAAAQAAFLAFWAAEGEAHFAKEEAHLLDALPAGDPEWEPVAARIRAEHAALRRAAVELRGDPPLEAVRDVGAQLAEHVRFEERTAFPLLEARLTEPQLERLASVLR